VALEKLTEEEKQSKFISFAIKLEDSFMVGSYNEVLQSKSKVPYEYFNVFLDRIIETIRFEIARSVEKSFEYLTLTDVLKFFYLEDAAALLQFAKTQETFAKDNGVAWKIDNNKLYFQPLDVDKHRYNALSSASELLQYAEELEKIV